MHLPVGANDRSVVCAEICAPGPNLWRATHEGAKGGRIQQIGHELLVFIEDAFETHRPLCLPDGLQQGLYVIKGAERRGI